MRNWSVLRTNVMKVQSAYMIRSQTKHCCRFLQRGDFAKGDCLHSWYSPHRIPLVAERDGPGNPYKRNYDIQVREMRCGCKNGASCTRNQENAIAIAMMRKLMTGGDQDHDCDEVGPRASSTKVAASASSRLTPAFIAVYSA